MPGKFDVSVMLFISLPTGAKTVFSAFQFTRHLGRTWNRRCSMGARPRSIISLERCASIVRFPSGYFGQPANDEFVDLLDIGARLFLLEKLGEKGSAVVANWCQTRDPRYTHWRSSPVSMLSIRPATINDVTLLRTLIRELAEFEHELDHVSIQESDLARDGFGTSPKFRALIAEWDEQPAGYALFFGYYSTWVGPGLYLEDLFVRQQFRGRGIGIALLASVARIALQEDCCAMRWEVLNWNEKAIGLYKALGAEFRNQWRSVFLTHEPLQRLAAKKPR